MKKILIVMISIILCIQVMAQTERITDFEGTEVIGVKVTSKNKKSNMIYYEDNREKHVVISPGFRMNSGIVDIGIGQGSKDIFDFEGLVINNKIQLGKLPSSIIFGYTQNEEDLIFYIPSKDGTEKTIAIPTKDFFKTLMGW